MRLCPRQSFALEVPVPFSAPSCAERTCADCLLVVEANLSNLEQEVPANEP